MPISVAAMETVGLGRGIATVQDEAALLARARQFDTDALALIHDSYYGPLFRYVAFRIGDRDAAEDLTSEVFTRFLAALRQRNPPSSTLRGWLYGVAAHVVSDHMRRRYRAPQVELHEAIASRETGPAEAAEAALVREDLKQAMAELTEEQQHVIALRFGHELPIQEVARAIGKTEGAVKQLQARAIAALARRLRPGTVE
jgi:RNA polymerase sigma-70 factor (ECF subfamily)